MTIDNVVIRDYGDYKVCEATVTSTYWKYRNNIVYFTDGSRWSSDYHTISDNIKKMCRHKWYKIAKANGVRRNALNIII